MTVMQLIVVTKGLTELGVVKRLCAISAVAIS